MRALLVLGTNTAMVLATLLALRTDAQAIPVFARKYQASCALCHGPAFPALNPAGRRFKENGYQLEAPAEGEARARSHLRPDPDERHEILGELPLALRAVSSAVLSPDVPAPGSNTLDLQPFEALYLLAGASLFPNVSFLVSSTLIPQASVHQAAIGFHNLLAGRALGDGHLNLRVGRLLLLDFARPEHRFLTAFGNPIATTALGLHPTVLDSTQHGVQIHGRVWQRRLFYHLALVQGAQGPDGIRDLDGGKDLFVELQGRLTPWFNIGVLGYQGRTAITDQSRGLTVRFVDRFRILGGLAHLETAALDLFGQLLQVNHDNPSGNHAHSSYWAYRLEARMPLSSRLFLVGRYDQLGSHHLSDQRFKHAVLHLGALLLTNLRLGLESSMPLDQVEESTVTFRLDVAL